MGIISPLKSPRAELADCLKQARAEIARLIRERDDALARLSEADAMRRADAALTAAREDAARLRDALRERVVAFSCAEKHWTGDFRIWECYACRMNWVEGSPERHAPDCLAALPEDYPR
jgi:lipopolysaccharide biosynthesis regulator YciM